MEHSQGRERSVTSAPVPETGSEKKIQAQPRMNAPCGERWGVARLARQGRGACGAQLLLDNRRKFRQGVVPARAAARRIRPA